MGPGNIETMSTSEMEEVLLAAEQRAAALAAADPAALRALMHPSLQWTTFNGDVLSREQYIAGNTGGVLTWRSQRLEDVRVVVVGETAVLTALVTDEVRKGGQDQSFTLRLTQTWVRAESGWQCLAGHAGPEVG
jgi:ketosteroid isomerase-like protein